MRPTYELSSLKTFMHVLNLLCASEDQLKRFVCRFSVSEVNYSWLLYNRVRKLLWEHRTKVPRLKTNRKCVNGLLHNISLWTYGGIWYTWERNGRHELSATSKGGMGTKLKVMKDLCLIRLHSANSTAYIQLKARFIWWSKLRSSWNEGAESGVPQRTLIILFVAEDTAQHDGCS